MIVACIHLIACVEAIGGAGAEIFAGRCSKCGVEAIVQIEEPGTLIGKGTGEPLTEALLEMPEPEAPGGELAESIAKTLREDPGPT